MAGVGRGAAALLLLVPAGAFLAWQSVKTAAVASIGIRNPKAVQGLAGDHPSVQIAAAMRELAVALAAKREAPRSPAIAALAGHPIAEEPLVLAAVAQLAKGDIAGGETLLVEARRRNPRSRLTRLLLLDRYITTNRTAEATREIGVLSGLIGRANPVLVPELVRLAQNPAQRRTVRAALAQKPELHEALLSHLVQKDANPDFILEMAGPNPPRPKSDNGWQSQLIGNLVKKGDIGRAHRLWQAFGGAASGEGVYDGGFRGRPGLPPFNWRLATGSDGVAELNPGGGLSITFYGRADAELASQLMMLKPGRFRVQFRAEGDTRGDGKNVVLRIACNGSNANILELPITNLAAAPRTLSADFTVPASGCAGQWLRLQGIAGEFPAEQTIVIRDLQIGGGRS